MARIYSFLVSAALFAAAILSPGSDQSTTLVMALDATTGRSINSNGATLSRSAGTQRSTQRLNVFVHMNSDTSTALGALKGQKFSSRADRVAAVHDGLKAHAMRSQSSVQTFLNRAAKAYGGGSAQPFTEVESLWLTNNVYIKGATPEFVEELRQHPDVKDVQTEIVFPPVRSLLTTVATPMADATTTATTTTSTTTTAQWGVSKINAPTVWNSQNYGKGVVIGVIDTGVRATHTAIAGTFRSSYNWFDPETLTPTPYDVNGHGTHVVGTIVGSNGMGVAPQATWFMCKGCRTDGCYAADLVKCFQFMLCPTTPDGSTKDCTKAPRIVNNSWGGGQGLSTFVDVVAAWRAAGIIPIVAAGNTGSTCATITTPGDYANIISVGATDVNDKLASFSSKGPTVNGLRKPDISAPGSLILSASYTSDTGVCFKSGTSMATPHVSGAVALLLSAKPTLTYDQVLQLLQKSAATASLSKATGFTCGGTLDSVFPNNQYGYGRVDAAQLLVAKLV